MNHVPKLCRSLGLASSNLHDTHRKKNRPHHFGYSLRELNFEGDIIINRYKVKTPKNKIYYIPDNTLCKYSLNLGLNRRTLSYYYNTKKEVKGWKVTKEKVCFSVKNNKLQKLEIKNHE